MFMKSLPGRHMEEGLARSIPREKWPTVVGQLSHYWHQLSMLQFDRIGRLFSPDGSARDCTIISIDDIGGPFSTSREYFAAHRQSQKDEILKKGKMDMETAAAFWLLHTALQSTIIEARARGPFPLGHIDLHFNNVLFDDQHNITGIIDWSDAQTVPIEKFFVTPEFGTFPGLSEAENEPLVAFRDAFAQAYKECDFEHSMSEQRITEISIDNFKSPSAIIGTAMWEILYRSTYTYPWRAVHMARLLCKECFGSDIEWADFLQFYETSPLIKSMRLIDATP